MRREIDEAVRAMAMRRCGAFTREEIRSLGGTIDLERRRIRSGTWLSGPGNVLLLAAFPSSLDQRRWVGLLLGGHDAHLSFEAAAELFGLEGTLRGDVVVTTPRMLHLEHRGYRFHQLDDVAPHHLTEVRGFRVTTVARTIVDLAAAISWIRLRRVIEDAIAKRITSYGEIATVLAEVRRRGKPGVRKLVATLDGLAGEPPPESEGERLLHDAARRAGVRLVRQHPLPGRAHLRGVVDGAVLESKLILESDSRSWHARNQAMANDRARDREAAREGWQTLRFLYEDLDHDLASCADDIRVVHERRLNSSASPADSAPLALQNEPGREPKCQTGGIRVPGT